MYNDTQQEFELRTSMGSVRTIYRTTDDKSPWPVVEVGCSRVDGIKVHT